MLALGRWRVGSQLDAPAGLSRGRRGRVAGSNTPIRGPYAGRVALSARARGSAYTHKIFRKIFRFAVSLLGAASQSGMWRFRANMRKKRAACGNARTPTCHIQRVSSSPSASSPCRVRHPLSRDSAAIGARGRHRARSSSRTWHDVAAPKARRKSRGRRLRAPRRTPVPPFPTSRV